MGIWKDAFNGTRNINYIISGDSRRYETYTRYEEYLNQMLSQLNITVNNNSVGGQGMLGWTNNTFNGNPADNYTVNAAINMTPGTGSNTILEFSLGQNDVDTDVAGYETLLNNALDAYLAQRPNTKIILVCPEYTSNTSNTTNMRNAYKNVADQRGFEFVDTYDMLADVFGDPNFYEDNVHQNYYGSIRIINFLLERVLPAPLKAEVTLPTPNPNTLSQSQINNGNTITLGQAFSKDNYTLDELLAFPTALGYGKFTSGGRRGRVVKVTNLNNTGTGSLREAIESSGPRYIVFDIGGNVNLTSEINLGSPSSSSGLQITIDEENCTILGQTAPGPGITITGGGLFIWSSNVCVRYFTSRPNDPNTSFSKSLRIRNNQEGGYVTENIMLDHLSLSHATDENLSIGGFVGPIRNISAQKCMIHKPLGAPDNGFSKNNITGRQTTKLSYVNCYFSHASDRNPFIAYDDSEAEVINNIMYCFNTGINMVYGADADILYNILKESNEEPAQFSWIAFYQNQTNNPTGQPEDSRLYHEGNIFLNGPESVSQAFYDYNAASRVFTDSNITEWLTTANDIENEVLTDSGNVLYRSSDSLDQAVIADYYASVGNRNDVSIPSKSTVTKSAGYDSIITGIDDTFTNAHGITSHNEVKTNWDFGTYNVVNNAGYTAIEMYSFYLADEFSKLTIDEEINPGPDPNPGNTITGNKGTLYLINA